MRLTTLLAAAALCFADSEPTTLVYANPMSFDFPVGLTVRLVGTINDDNGWPVPRGLLGKVLDVSNDGNRIQCSFPELKGDGLRREAVITVRVTDITPWVPPPAALLSVNDVRTMLDCGNYNETSWSAMQIAVLRSWIRDLIKTGAEPTMDNLRVSTSKVHGALWAVSGKELTHERRLMSDYHLDRRFGEETVAALREALGRPSRRFQATSTRI